MKALKMLLMSSEFYNLLFVHKRYGNTDPRKMIHLPYASNDDPENLCIRWVWSTFLLFIDLLYNLYYNSVHDSKSQIIGRTAR